jgi:hypothetical protein
MQHILVYGDSIVLAGLTEQMAKYPHLQVYCRSTLSDLGDLAVYDSVLVDFNEPCARDVVKLLSVRPDLRVIGLNSTLGVLTCLDGNVYLVQSLDEVVDYLSILQ